MTRWDDTLGVVGTAGSPAPGRLPDPVRGALGQPGAAALVLCDVDRSAGGPGRTTGPNCQLVPTNALLYTIEATAGSDNDGCAPTSVAAVERLELDRHEYGNAALAYRRIEASGDPAVRPWARHRLGRTLAKDGKTLEARQMYQ
jgi:hypothetical protein